MSFHVCICRRRINVRHDDGQDGSFSRLPSPDFPQIRFEIDAPSPTPLSINFLISLYKQIILNVTILEIIFNSQ